MVKQAALILVSLPVTGHLPVTINLAKRLMNHDRRIQKVTILSWKLPFARHANVYAESLAASQPCISLVDLPDVKDPPPLELYVRSSEAYIYQYVKKAKPLLREIISSLISSYHASDSVCVEGLVLDFFSDPLIDVGNELNLPSYIFLTCNAGFLGMMRYLPERHRMIVSEFDRISGDEGLLIPGFVSSVPAMVMPPGLFKKDAYEAYVKLAERFVDAKGILVNTFTELEPHALDYFGRAENYPPVYSVGPILNLEDRLNPNLDPAEHDQIVKWLDEQPESSVVFLCFGSKGIFDAPQVKEIARGLELCRCRFLWSIRTNPLEHVSPFDLLPEGFLSRVAGHGMVCGWAPQVEVLAHKATAAFVSHCGWNSILESLWHGVPIVTWPMYAEQQLNAFKMVKEQGLAVELRLDYALALGGDVVAAEEIVRAVRSLIDGGDTVRKKVKAMAEEAKKAVVNGGSSFVAMTRFVNDMIGEDDF